MQHTSFIHHLEHFYFSFCAHWMSSRLFTVTALYKLLTSIVPFGVGSLCCLKLRTYLLITVVLCVEVVDMGPSVVCRWSMVVGCRQQAVRPFLTTSDVCLRWATTSCRPPMMPAVGPGYRLRVERLDRTAEETTRRRCHRHQSAVSWVAVRSVHRWTVSHFTRGPRPTWLVGRRQPSIRHWHLKMHRHYSSSNSIDYRQVADHIRHHGTGFRELGTYPKKTADFIG